MQHFFYKKYDGKTLKSGQMHKSKHIFLFFNAFFLFLFFFKKRKIQKKWIGCGPTKMGQSTTLMCWAGPVQPTGMGREQPNPITNSIHVKWINSRSSLHVNSNWWSVNHHERLTCYCRRVEEVEVVVPAVVASKMTACGGRSRCQKSVGLCWNSVVSSLLLLLLCRSWGERT